MQIATHECTNDTQATFPPLRLRLVVICITSSMQVYVCLCVYMFMCVYLCILMYAYCRLTRLPVCLARKIRSCSLQIDNHLYYCNTSHTTWDSSMLHTDSMCDNQLFKLQPPSQSLHKSNNILTLLHLTIWQHSICKLLECRRLQYSCIPC